MSIFTNRDAKPFKSGYPGTGEISPSKVQKVIRENRDTLADPKKMADPDNKSKS
jgi:hypothetical protein